MKPHSITEKQKNRELDSLMVNALQDIHYISRGQCGSIGRRYFDAGPETSFFPLRTPATVALIGELTASQLLEISNVLRRLEGEALELDKKYKDVQ